MDGMDRPRWPGPKGMTRPPYGPGGQNHDPKIITLASAQGWRCAYCPTVMSRDLIPEGQRYPDHYATVDHVIPKGSGGKATWDNEIAACMACNSARGCYGAILFWSLMQRHAHDRRLVVKTIRAMKPQARRKATKRAIRALRAGT